MGNPGSPADESEVPTLAPGTVLGKYSIIRLLGSGGMGAVYEATHTEIGKKVAIKVLSPMIAAVPGARARFLREAQLTSRVRHPHIVDVADMGSDGGNTYIVMEFLHGEDLAQRLERLGPVGIEEMADIMLPVCSAVAAAHAAGITHRDLKPQNIFLGAGTRRVHPKVLDFGISKGNDAVTQAGTLTGTGAMIGTPYYLAPEQIMDSKSAGSASDQYALGIILYECLTGKRPYDGDNLFVVFQGIVGGTPKRPRELRPEIPPEMEEVTLRAMRSDPKLRFPTIEDFGRALLPFASARARMIWDEAFSGAATGTDSVPPGRPSIAVMPTPSPPTRASTLMPPGLKNPSGVGPIPGARDADAAAQDDDVAIAGAAVASPDRRNLAGLAGVDRGGFGARVGGDVEVASGRHRSIGRRHGPGPAARAQQEGDRHRGRGRRRGRRRRAVLPARRIERHEDGGARDRTGRRGAGRRAGPRGRPAGPGRARPRLPPPNR